MVFDELTILVGCWWKTRPRVGFGSSKPNSPRGTGKGLGVAFFFFFFGFRYDADYKASNEGDEE